MRICRWQFKAQHFDSVMLFKMGKFYEMFEMDSHVGSDVLGLSYMKVPITLDPKAYVKLSAWSVQGLSCSQEALRHCWLGQDAGVRQKAASGEGLS